MAGDRQQKNHLTPMPEPAIITHKKTKQTNTLTESSSVNPIPTESRGS